MELKAEIDLNRLPKHIAIIMDGNGRWAKKKGNHRIFGHRNGVKAVRETIEASAELGVKFLTLYAFSTENWNRPKMEVDALMELLMNSLVNELETLCKNNIQLKTIGDTASLPADARQRLYDVMSQTKDNTGLNLILALSYSGRCEIANAVKDIAAMAKNGQINPDDIDQCFIQQFLDTRDYPDPELLIRTSGELRISNFLLWQIAYAELYFTDTLWPDFRKNDLYKAIIDFQKRERRFGMTSEQLPQINNA